MLGGINTAVLIASSLTVALAVHAAQEGKQRQILRYLGGTLLLGVVFLVIKYFDTTRSSSCTTRITRTRWSACSRCRAGSTWTAS